MVNKSDIFEAVMTNLLSGDAIEAIYTLRALADEIEEHGIPNREDMCRIMASFLEDEDEDYVPRLRNNFDDDDEDFGNGDEEIGSLFDPQDD